MTKVRSTTTTFHIMHADEYKIMNRVLFIDTIDFMEYPPGGTLNYARQMMNAFGDRLFLVGIVTDDTPVGRWVKKSINGVTYDYFAIGCREKKAGRPFIPPRFSGYMQLKRHKHAILSCGATSAFMQIHEVIMAAGDWGWENLCFRFPGVENPLNISRYPGAKLLAGIFDDLFFPALSRAHLILAAADEESIQDMISRAKGCVDAGRVVQFPTRVDTSVFYPDERNSGKTALGFKPDETLIVVSGRIHWAKGWKFLIDAFKTFLQRKPNACLCFIGDGQDRNKLERYISQLGLEGRVRVTGFKTPHEVADYLRAADLFAMGSYKEGWATVMVEALACGLPIVSTHVSSAKAIISEGRNGYVVKNRDPVEFAETMCRALELENIKQYSGAMTEKYALHSLGKDLGKLFPPLGSENDS